MVRRESSLIDPKILSSEKSVENSDDRKFQECFHSIYTQLNDDVTSLNDSNDVIFRLCQALNNISTVCVSFLDKDRVTNQNKK